MAARGMPVGEGEGPRHGSSEDFVYGWLKDAITTGELRPGERVTENQIAERLKVSRTPVRAAIRLLEDQRLLERQPGTGLVVTDLTVEQLDDIYTTRAVLMGLAARLAAQRMTARDHMKLHLLQDEIESLTKAGEYRQLAVVNDVFHDEIVAASKNETVTSLLSQIHLSIIRYRHTTLLVPGRAQEAISEHRELIAAIEARDGDEAERVGRAHVTNAHLARVRQQAELELEKYKLEATES